MKKCIFCDGECSGKKRSKEHIFPEHLLKEFSILKEKLAHSPFMSDKSNFSGGYAYVEPGERSLTYSGFLAGQICTNCNCGWMSELENAVKQYLYKLIRGELNIESLTIKEQNLLACWGCKTGIVLSQSIGAWLYLIPREHARLLYQYRGNAIPDQVAIFAYSSRSDDYLWSLCPLWYIETNQSMERAEVIKEHESSYKIFMQLGKLMLIVCHWSTKGAVYKYEHWGPQPIGGLDLCRVASTDCRKHFSVESEQFMMAIGVYLTK